MCGYVLFPSSTSSTYIALQPLGVFDLSLIFNIHSITALRCIWSIFDIFDISDTHSITALRYIWYIFDIDSITYKWYHIKKGMIKMCLYVPFPSLTSSTYIALQPLGVFDLSLTSSTKIALHSKKIRITSPTPLTCHIPGTLFEWQCRL